jgi:hypothetical protein
MPKRITLSKSTDLADISTSDDAIGIVMRGHKYIQQALRQLIEDAVPRPDAGLSNLKYDRALALANTLALITPEEYTFLKLVDSLRNKLGHDDFELTSQHEIEAMYLWGQAMNHPFLEGLAERYEGEHFPRLLRITLITLTYTLLNRQKQIASEGKRLPELVADVKVGIDGYGTFAAAFVMDRAARGKQSEYDVSAGVKLTHPAG